MEDYTPTLGMKIKGCFEELTYQFRYQWVMRVQFLTTLNVESLNSTCEFAA